MKGWQYGESTADPFIPAMASSSDIVNTASTLLKAAAGAGLRYYITLPTPLIGSLNTAINVQCSVTLAAVRASITGYIAT